MTEKQIFSTAVRILGLWFTAQAFISFVMQTRLLVAYWNRIDVIQQFNFWSPALYVIVGLFLIKRTSYIVKFVFPAKTKD